MKLMFWITFDLVIYFPNPLYLSRTKILTLGSNFRT